MEDGLEGREGSGFLFGTGKRSESLKRVVRFGLVTMKCWSKPENPKSQTLEPERILPCPPILSSGSYVPHSEESSKSDGNNEAIRKTPQTADLTFKYNLEPKWLES